MYFKVEFIGELRFIDNLLGLLCKSAFLFSSTARYQTKLKCVFSIEFSLFSTYVFFCFNQDNDLAVRNDQAKVCLSTVCL